MAHLQIRIDEDIKKEFIEKVEKETGLKASQWVRSQIVNFLKEKKDNTTLDIITE